MTLQGYTYQIGDLFTTSKTGVTGRIYSFAPQSNTVTRVGLLLANGAKRFAMVKTSKYIILIGAGFKFPPFLGPGSSGQYHMDYG